MTIYNPATSLIRLSEVSSSDRHPNGALAIMENLSNHDIVGMTAFWVNPMLKSPTGKVRTIHQHTDSFMLPGPIRPVVAARSRSFLAPGAVTPERLTNPGTGSVGGLPDPDSDVPGWTLTIDAILFATGELVGPDTLHLKESTIARKAAATKVTATVRQAIADRASVAAVFDELTAIPPEFHTSPPSIQALMEFNEVRRVVGDLQRYP